MDLPIIDVWSASFNTPLLVSIGLAYRGPDTPIDLTSCAQSNYEIEEIRESESAFLLFARHGKTNRQVVMKKLREYKDIRYHLETVSDRQQCQLEALKWNRMFTPDVYLGLAPVCSWNLYHKNISIGEIIKNPTREMLDPNAEYVLLMERLPDDWRLDLLMNEKNAIFSRNYIYLNLLATRIADIHRNLAVMPVTSNRGIKWGSCEQLENKLIHNFAFLGLELSGWQGSYRWLKNILSSLKDALHQVIQQGQHPRHFEQSLDRPSSALKDTLNTIKDTLLQIITCDQYQHYFGQRIREQRIKRCHGDLKSPNIWIAPTRLGQDGEPRMGVWILDAIDFNPIYSNIDILSDFAMLVIDIQARTKSLKLADYLIDIYLQRTGQEDEVARAVLAYYLVEKAIVGAIVSILYDNLPELGLDFLEVAKIRMKDLTSGAQTQRYKIKVPRSRLLTPLRRLKSLQFTQDKATLHY